MMQMCPVNIYEPRYPAVELITISKGTGIAITHGVLAPLRLVVRNNRFLLETEPPHRQLFCSTKPWFSWRLDAGWLGGWRGDGLLRAALLRGAPSAPLFVSLFGQEGAVILLGFNED